jgi:hypothetical protein
MPVSFAGDIPIKDILTVDEMRAELGFQQIEKEEIHTEQEEIYKEDANTN